MIVSLQTRRPLPDDVAAGIAAGLAAVAAEPAPAPAAPPTNLLDRWAPGEAEGGAEAPPPLDLAGRDPLGLATDAGLVARAAEIAAAALSEGAEAGAGAASLARRLETALAGLVGLPHARLLPGPEEAGAAAIRALVGAGDHVLVDNLAGRGLQLGADRSGADVHRTPHASVRSVARWLDAIRLNSPRAGILIVAESLPRRGGEPTDLPALQALAREHRATLLVDLTHDLGVTGEGGGQPDALGLRGGLDVVTGALSALGGGAGGFAASSHPGLAQAFAARGPARGRAPAPLQAALALAAVEFLRSPEGQRRRDRLLVNGCALALLLRAEGFEVQGAPGPLLSVPLGRRRAGARTLAALGQRGVAAELVEGPGGDGAGSRLHLRVAARHGRADLGAAVAALAAAWAEEDGGRAAAKERPSAESRTLS